MTKTTAFDVCGYIDTFLPSRGFIAFRSGLSRVGTDALRAACEHRSGLSSVCGLQLRDQFVDLLWESCLTATRVMTNVTFTQPVEKVVNSAPTQLERANPKKQKTGNAPIDVTITMGSVQFDQQTLDEDKKETQALVTSFPRR